MPAILPAAAPLAMACRRRCRFHQRGWNAPYLEAPRVFAANQTGRLWLVAFPRHNRAETAPTARFDRDQSPPSQSNDQSGCQVFLSESEPSTHGWMIQTEDANPRVRTRWRMAIPQAHRTAFER